MAAKKTILIVDDHPLIREGLKNLIKTVKNHRANIMQKLDIHSIHELIRYAAKLIRSLQKAEGNPPCYGKASGQYVTV